VPDAVAKIAEGNIRAAVCIMDLMKHSEEIDPLSYLKVIGPVMLLDSLGIYGPNVWVIFKDVCEQNHARMLAVLRATQLGMLSSEALLEVSNRYRNEGKVKTIDVAELYFKVKTFLKTSTPTTGPIYIDRPQGPVTKQLQNYKGL
jgi:hypothetical protein